MKLLIISHTEHYTQGETIVGWNPTVREIDELATVFETVTHLAPLHYSKAPQSAMAYRAANIHYQPLFPSGGDGFLNKLKILFYAIPNLIKINRACKKADLIHFRAPTNLGVYTLPFLWFYKNKKQWIKYAGNWVQQKKPWSYRFQKWWIEKNFNRAIATINGRWENQPQHIITFENPCLTQDEYTSAKKTEKNWEGKLRICFAGALHPEKGALKIIEAINTMEDIEQVFDKIMIAGDGKEREKLERAPCKIPIEMKGFLSKQALFNVYAQAHVIVLPSQNEGFPKAIAEAMAFGCIPLVTNVSCIGQYVQHSISGFLLSGNNVKELSTQLREIGRTERKALIDISDKAKDISGLFTYEHYISKIKTIFEF